MVFYIFKIIFHFSSGISLGNIVCSGSGKIWLDDIKCTGEESKLTDCVIEKWGTRNYPHSNDVGIRCSNDSTSMLYVSILLGFYMVPKMIITIKPATNSFK